VFLKEQNVSKMELLVPSCESVRGPAIKIALPVRLRLGGASPVFHLKMSNDTIPQKMLFLNTRARKNV
jgi:hypothetical protein